MLGGALAAVAAHHLESRPPAVPADAVALVAAHPVHRADYERALAALQGERRTPIGASERRLALERLVEEEVLLQAALAADRARSDPAVARALVASVLAPVLAGAEAEVDVAAATAPPELARAAARDAAFTRFVRELRDGAEIRRLE